MVVQEARPIVIPDMQASSLYQGTKLTGAIVSLPLMIGLRVIGVMTLAWSEPRDFGENMMRTFRLMADQAALAIENARLFQNERREKERMAQELEEARTPGR